MLLEHLAGSLASAIPVSTQLDIAAQHHLFMMGRNGSNIKHIMQRTGAQIHFPDPSNPQKKSTVYLQGTIESVCLARQYLMVNTCGETCFKKYIDYRKYAHYVFMGQMEVRMQRNDYYLCCNKLIQPSALVLSMSCVFIVI